MVITKDLSRLGRNYVQSGYYTENFFPEHNVRYIAILDNIDTAISDSANNDIAPFKSILNEMYAKDTSKKINSVLQSKRKQGEYLGLPPYGYKKDPKDKYHLVIDRKAAEVVRTIFRMFLGGYGTMQIADHLSEQKIPIPSDYNKRKRGTKSISYGLWAQSTVRFILSNEVYTGTVVQGKRKKISFKSKKFAHVPEDDWVRIPNMHEAIISKEDFERAQKAIITTKGSRITENDYLFKGLLKCFDCKGYIGIRNPDKNGNIYGRCQRYSRYSKFDVCSPHNFNYQVFEESMIGLLREICKEYSNKKKLEEIAKKSKLKEDKLSDLRNKIKTYQTKIEKETRKLELLYEDRLAEIITVDSYIEKANNINKEVEDYNKRINELKQELNGKNQEENKNKKLDSLVDEFLSLQKPNKEIIREFIERIEIHSNKQVDIYFNFKPLQELNEFKEKIICAKKEYKRKVS